MSISRFKRYVKWLFRGNLYFSKTLKPLFAILCTKRSLSVTLVHAPTYKKKKAKKKVQKIVCATVDLFETLDLLFINQFLNQLCVLGF